MAGKSYSAGRIFLQVVPSFKNLQREIGREVNKANEPLARQQEELGQKHEEARQRGARKARARTTDEILREEEKQQQARLSQYQKFTQMYLGEVVKESKRRKAIEDKNHKLFMDREADIAKARIAGERKANDLVSKMRSQSIKDEMAQRDRNARYYANLQRLLAEGDIRLAKEAAKERQKVEEQAARERTKLAAEEAAAEARIEARNEARRKIIRNRRINERLADLRATEAAERRLAGGEIGSRLRKGAKGAADAIGVMRITADSSPARIELAALREELLRISNQKIGVDVDVDAAQADIEAIQARLQKLAKNKDAEIDVDVNATAALVALKRIEQQIDEINRKRVSGGIAGWFAGMRSSAEDGANSFRIFNPRIFALITLLPMLAPLLASTAAGLGAIATAAIGGAAGLGVMILGFTGIGDAVSAMGDVQDNQAKDTLQREKTIRNALRSLRDAEQGLSRARTQAARNTEAASEAVERARRGLADTERSVARQIRDALKAQEDAEKSLARAQKDATDAQVDLMEARKQAQRDQDALADRIASGKLDERQALIDLFNAQVAYNAAMADGGATNLEREEASIALERAQLAIKGIRQENKELIEEQKKGVSGNQGLVAAQERYTEALDAQKRAQEGVTEAEARVREVRIDGARDIADAQRSVADAIESQQQTAADNAESIRDAQERLADSQAAYQEALEQTGDIGSASMQKLEQAMGKLSPAGRDFATWLFGLRGWFYELRAIVQEGMLPELQAMLQGLIDRYGPGFEKFIGSMAEVVGRFFTTFGQALQSPVMVQFFETMAQYAPTFFTQWGDLAINLMEIFAGLATAFAPFAEEFMNGLVDMTDSWAEWAAGLADSDGFAAFLDYVRTEGPKLLDLIGDIFQTIINIGIGFAQTGVFDAIAGFFKFLSEMDPNILAGIVQGLLMMGIASQVAAGINSLIISLMLLTSTTVGLVTLGLGALVLGLVWAYNNVEWFRQGVDFVWQKIKEYAAVFLEWIQTTFMPWWNETALPAITYVFQEIGRVAKWLWDYILFPVFELFWQVASQVFRLFAALWNAILWPVFKAIATGVLWLWNNVFSPVWAWVGEAFRNMVGIIKWVWENILSPVFDAVISALEGDFYGAFESVLTAIEGLWNGLKRIFAVPVNFVIETVLNNGLFAAFNKVMEILGSDTRIPRLARVTWGEDAPKVNKKRSGRLEFATGGVMPGYTPGRDIHHFYSPTGGGLSLSGGEAIMRPEFTRLVGGEAGVHYLNAMARRGQLPWQQFAIGGMVKPVNAKPGFPWGSYPSGKPHKALDLPVRIGTPVVAPWAGKILKDGWDNSGYGTHVRMQNYGGGMGTFTVLGHLLRELVSVGQQVNQGQLLGYSGNSGNSTGPHLHLAVVMDPLNAAATGINFTAAFNGGRSVTPAAGRGVDLPWWAEKPLDFLRGIVNGVVGKIPVDGIFGDMLKGIPNKLFDGVEEFLGGILGIGPGTDDVSGGELPNNGVMMYDNGGYLQPGLTTVLNMTGRPEPVFTADQWDRMEAGGGALIGTYAPTFNDSDVTAADVADELVYALRRVSHGGRFAGRAR